MTPHPDFQLEALFSPLDLVFDNDHDKNDSPFDNDHDEIDSPLGCRARTSSIVFSISPGRAISPSFSPRDYDDDDEGHDDDNGDEDGDENGISRCDFDNDDIIIIA